VVVVVVVVAAAVVVVAAAVVVAFAFHVPVQLPVPVHASPTAM